MHQSILGSHDTATITRNRRRGIKWNYAELCGIEPGNCRSKVTVINPLLAPFRKSRNFAILWPGAGVMYALGRLEILLTSSHHEAELIHYLDN